MSLALLVAGACGQGEITAHYGDGQLAGGDEHAWPPGDWDWGGGGLPAGLTSVERTALQRIFPVAYTILRTQQAGHDYFTAADPGNGFLGRAYVTSNFGYGGPIVAFTGIRPNGFSIRCEPTDWRYEDGPYMAAVLHRSWLDQFDNLDRAQVDPATEDWGPYAIDVVSGATYSSLGVVNDVWDAFRAYDAVNELCPIPGVCP